MPPGRPRSLVKKLFVLPFTIVNNRYEAGEIFAEGGQARLIRAKDRISGRHCLLKTGETDEAIRQEAIRSVQWNHPYILKAFDYGIHPELGAYAAFPEIRAPSLLNWVRKKQSKQDFHRVVLQIAEFLAFLHHRGFLYNDF